MFLFVKIPLDFFKIRFLSFGSHGVVPIYYRKEEPSPFRVADDRFGESHFSFGGSSDGEKILASSKSIVISGMMGSNSRSQRGCK